MASEPYDPDTGEIMDASLAPDDGFADENDPLAIRSDAEFEEAIHASLEEGAETSDPFPEEEDSEAASAVGPERALFDEAVEGAVRGDRPPMKDDEDWRKHNQTAYNVTADELRQFIERYEQLQAEKKDIGEQMAEVMAEAKGRGYDTKVMRKVISLRKRRPDEVAEKEAVLEMYKSALGMA